MTVITGACFCGAIQFAIDGPLRPARSCHCSQCRKAFSGPGSAMSPLEPGTFRWTQGEDSVKIYASKHGPGLGFCETCGSTLVGLYKGEVMGVALGVLDGDPEVTIGDHIFVGSKASWDVIGGEAPQHDAWPAVEG